MAQQAAIAGHLASNWTTVYQRHSLHVMDGPLRCVLGLYITRCPHSLHRINSLVFIGVFAPQSMCQRVPTR